MRKGWGKLLTTICNCTDSRFLGFLVAAAIFIAVILLEKAWNAVFNPMPSCIEDARPGTMLVHFDRDGQRRVKRDECETTNVYDIEEMASDRLAGRYCVRVELKTTDGKVYVYTQRSIKARGW
jgi:hypothetical protein